MTDDRLVQFLSDQTRVTVANPAAPSVASWTGTIIALADDPSLVLERDDGLPRVLLPQEFTVEPVNLPAKGSVGPLEAYGPPQRPPEPPAPEQPTGAPEMCCHHCARAEVDRLREEATWSQLRAETGAERAQAEQLALNAECGKLAELLRQADIRADGLRARINEMDREAAQARATIERARALADAWDRIAHTAAHAYAKALRATLDSPTEPGPGLDPDEGSGLWLSTPLADPPPVDPLTAVKARLERAMKGMAP